MSQPRWAFEKELETQWKRPGRLRYLGAARALGVSDGTRTRDSQDHNLVLYQLNYAHHHR